MSTRRNAARKEFARVLAMSLRAAGHDVADVSVLPGRLTAWNAAGCIVADVTAQTLGKAAVGIWAALSARSDAEVTR